MLSRIRSVLVGLAIGACVLGAAAPALAQSTVLVFDSQPGDYIGAGERRTYTPADGAFYVRRNFDNGVALQVIGPDQIFSWYLDFAGAGKVPLTVGSYRTTRRSSYGVADTMDISGSSRGCSATGGRFDILEVVYADDGTVLRFAADFEQHCEDLVPALFGAIRYQSTVVDAVPFGGRYPAYSVTISPADGGVVTGENIDCGHGASNCAVTFTAPTYQLLKATADPGYQLLGWTGACEGGTSISLHVQSPRVCAPLFGLDPPPAPRISLLIDSQAGEYIGDTLQQRYDEVNSAWSAQTRNGGNGLIFTITGSDGGWYDVEFRAPGEYSNRLAPGDYQGALRAPFSYPAPGLDVSGNGSGCNEISGRFVIYESEFNADGTIARFAADFEQHCDHQVPALFGSVRYRSVVGGLLPFGGARPVFRVIAAASGYGKITGGGMDCGGNFPWCTAARNTAGPITLTAAPAFGYTLSAWSGDCSGASLSTIVQVDTPDKQCSAHFIRTVADTTAPVLSRLPGNQRVLTTSAAGALVTWMPPLAVDAVDGAVAVTCAPASRTAFPVGSTTVTCSALDMSSNQATTTFTVTVARRALGVDITGDGQGDIVWRSPGGEILVWVMSGSTPVNGRYLGTVAPNWHIAAVGDFTGDGSADFVWQSEAGTVVLWAMQGTTHVATHMLYNGDTPWRVAAAADLDGDGHLDLVWQGPSGNVAAWMMNGLTTVSIEFLFDADTPWRVVAAGDLDGDGRTDLIWQSPTGSAAAWLMNGVTRREVAWLFDGETDWRIAAVANLNGDTSVDLVWQNPFGKALAWLMNGVVRASVLPLYEGPTDWRITGPR